MCVSVVYKTRGILTWCSSVDMCNGGTPSLERDSVYFVRRDIPSSSTGEGGGRKGGREGKKRERLFFSLHATLSNSLILTKATRTPFFFFPFLFWPRRWLLLPTTHNLLLLATLSVTPLGVACCCVCCVCYRNDRTGAWLPSFDLHILQEGVHCTIGDQMPNRRQNETPTRPPHRQPMVSTPAQPPPLLDTLGCCYPSNRRDMLGALVVLVVISFSPRRVNGLSH